MRVPEQATLFANDYDFEVLTELPAGGAEARRFYYPGAKRDGGKDGLIVRVNPADAEPWVGLFASMDASQSLMNGIFTCPDPDMICVVSGGSGYLVHTSMPEWSSEVPVVPITRVLQLTRRQLLIFADFTSLCAWGRDGLAWRTKRLAWDELQIVEYDDEKVLGAGFDPTQSEPVRFVVDVMTGRHEGGSSPEMYEHRATGPRPV